MKRIVGILLSAAMLLSLLPVPAMAGSQDWLDATFFDNNRPEGYGLGTSDGTLAADASGTVKFSVSGFVSLPSSGTIEGVYLVDADSGAERYDLRDSRYCESADFLDESQVHDLDGDHGLEIWMQNLEIPGAALGDYRLKVVTNVGTWISEAYSDEYYSTEGFVRIVDGAELLNKPVITTSSLPTATLGKAYSAALEAAPHTEGAPISWSLIDGTLPDGLSLAPDGAVSGTPTAAGSFRFTVRASEEGGLAAERQLTVYVSYPAPTVTTSGLPDARLSKPYLARLEAEPYLPGGALTWSLGSGALPDGLSLAPDGTISGTPTAEGVFSFVPMATETATGVGSGRGFTIRVEKPAVLVTLPAGIGEVTGYVCLRGSFPEGQRTLWHHDYYAPEALPDDLSLPDALFKGGCSALELLASVNGFQSVIARFDGPLSGGSEAVLTTDGCTAAVLLERVTLPGLIEGADYSILRITDESSGEYIYSGQLPCLVPADHSYAVDVRGRGSSAAAGYQWGTQGGLLVRSHELRLAAPAQYAADVSVRGAVKWENGEAAALALVYATQSVGGIGRTSVARTDVNGHFSIPVYPGAECAFSVQPLGTSAFVASGGTLAAADADVSDHQIGIRHVTLTAEIRLDAPDSDPEVVSRYLKKNGWLKLTASSASATDVFDLHLDHSDPHVFTNTIRSGDDTLACIFYGDAFEPARKSVTVADGTASVSFQSTLKPGVVALLSAKTTLTALYVFYGSDGRYLGESNTFGVNTAGDRARACPAGTAKVALVPVFYASLLQNTSFDDLTEDQCLHAWTLSEPLSAGKIAALEDFSFDSAASENAQFVTRPASSFMPNVDSFTSENDVIAFTGEIGLDEGMSAGQVTRLVVHTKSPDGYYRNSAYARALVIDGEVIDLGYEDHCDYGYTLSHSLPCSFTLYCSPGAEDLDMLLTVEADVVSGGKAFNGQLVGEAKVTRPGAALRTLSSFVCGDTVRVSGVAKPNEAVVIRDGETVIGTAEADEWGEWTAAVPLFGIDAALPTAHRLTAVSASGAVTEALTVIHDAAGPELKSLTMAFRSYSGDHTLNVGESYIFGGRMDDLCVKAVFEHPEQLSYMEAWGCRVVFKVCLADGTIEFLEAAGDGPEFTAQLEGSITSAVNRIEVLYVPAAHSVYDPATGTGALGADAAEAVRNGVSAAKENAISTPTYDYSVTFDTDGRAVLTGESSAPLSDALKETIELCREHNLTVTAVSGSGDDHRPVGAWISESAAAASRMNLDAAGSDAHSARIFTLSRNFKDGESSAEAAYENDKAWFAGVKGVKHLTTTIGTDGGAYEIYTFEKHVTLGGKDVVLYTISATFLNCDGFFSENAALEFDPHFCLESVFHEAGLTEASLMWGDVEQDYPMEDGDFCSEESEFFDKDNFHYNGSFTPASATSQSAVNLLHGEDDGNSLFAPPSGSTVCAGLSAAAKDQEFSKLAGEAGTTLTIVESIDYGFKAVELGVEIDQMDQDIERLKSSPCYQKLTDSQKEMFDSAYDEFQYWKKETNFYRGGHALTTFGCNLGGITAETPLIGGIVAGAGEMNSRVGGRVVNNCVANLVVTYEKSFGTMKGVLRSRGKQLKDADCEGRPRGGGGGGATKPGSDGDGGNTPNGNDPSGIVYEAVIENPVRGALVTLYYAVDAQGRPVTAENTAAAAELLPADSVRELVPRRATQVTDADGRYMWGVPAGLWYVTANAGGRQGDSNADLAATVGAAGRQLLPVLPVQLDVNIPVVDMNAPMIEEIRFAPDGVVVTFDKYMRDGAGEAGSVLDKANFALSDEWGPLPGITLEPVTQGHTSANIDGADMRTYTKSVRILPPAGMVLRGALTLTVSGAVTSYAGTALGYDYTDSGTVSGGSGASDYVERAYETILGRSGDEAGVANWVSELAGGEGAGEIIAAFFRSEEYRARGLTNAETVTLCYRAMLSREPDAAGLENWTALLDDGYSTTKLVSEFVESPEFAAICALYALTPGHITLSERDENSNITRFVQRCYTFALDREADEAGLNEWCAHLLTQDLDPERVAFGFVFSDESKAMARSDEDFIAMLYRMMLDREPDAAGLENWVSALAQNTAAEIAYDAAFETGRSETDAIDQTRQNIYALFAASDEFAQMIANFGF